MDLLSCVGTGRVSTSGAGMFHHWECSFQTSRSGSQYDPVEEAAHGF